MSDLRAAVDDYLAVRRALGFKLERDGRLLPAFVTYLEEAGASVVTTELALAWAKQPAGASPNWWAMRMSAIRGFARHLQAFVSETEVPPANLLPERSHRATPFLYSNADIAALIDAAGTLRSPLKAATYRTLIGLLAVTGMRIGEVIRLDRDDVDWENGLLTVLASKFNKSREIPLHPSTTAALGTYARLRDQLCPQRVAQSFFVSTTATRLTYNAFHSQFSILVRRAGLQQRSPVCRPRPHDLRHTFAVRTLLDWYHAGIDVQARLPQLSTYLGHLDPTSTYWYLSGAPELLALAGQRLEHAQAEQP